MEPVKETPRMEAGQIPKQDAGSLESALKKEILAAGVIPAHVAVIMDGNGRWANARGLPRLAGHRASKKSVRQVLEGCAKPRRNTRERVNSIDCGNREGCLCIDLLVIVKRRFFDSQCAQMMHTRLIEVVYLIWP